ncbi:MAG TPA: trehalose-6-phosphate synthase [Chloroflexota bacterium]
MLSPWRHSASGTVDLNRFGSMPGWVKLGEPLTHDDHASPRLYVLSQRGPLTFDFGDPNQSQNSATAQGSGRALRASPASGGLATALGALSRSERFCWVAAAMSEGDQAVAKGGVAWPIGPSELRMVSLPRPVLQTHQCGFANPLLWLLQHGLSDRLIWPRSEEAILDAWQNGYVAANQALAQELVAAARQTPEPTVLVQDYHLYLAPRLIRQALPHASISHFVHIPWPDPDAWRLLPRHIVREILEGLCAADVVGFQTPGDADRFLATCNAYGCAPSRDSLTSQTHPLVRSYPITVNAAELIQQAVARGNEPGNGAWSTEFKGQTIVRIDRLDPTKNIPAGFRAFGQLLERQPTLRERVRFVAHLVPSRSELPEYQREKRAAYDAAQFVNRRFGTPRWQPIEILYEENRELAMELLGRYDVLLVNPLADGMNLVAKEGPMVNRHDGVLVLSERAGARAELGWWALTIDPTDVNATAAALGRALTMTRPERRRRAEGLRRKVTSSSLSEWLDRQLSDLAEARQNRRGSLVHSLVA